MTTATTPGPLVEPERTALIAALRIKASRGHNNSADLLSVIESGKELPAGRLQLARQIRHELESGLTYKGGTTYAAPNYAKKAPRAPVAAVPAEGMDLGETLSDKLRQKLCTVSSPECVELLQASLKDAQVRKRIAALAQAHSIGLTDFEVFAAVDQHREHARLAASGIDDDE